eukprot:scaffold39848_cov64-Phaeocystis_antarctica.AAC.1
MRTGRGGKAQRGSEVQIRCRTCARSGCEEDAMRVLRGRADLSAVTWCTEKAEKEATTSSAQQRWHRPGIEQH